MAEFVYHLWHFCNSVIDAYIFVAIGLFLGYMFLVKLREHLKRLMLLANLGLLVATGIFAVIFVFDEVIVFARGVDEDKYDVAVFKVFGHYWPVYWGTLLCKGLLPQLIWIKKVRHNVWTSIIVVPLLFMDIILERMVLYRDYVPSCWTPSIHFTDFILPGFFYFLLIVGVYWVTKRKVG